MRSTDSKESRKVHCPRCNAALTWSAANPFRPFCSERCKLIDFGQWASGSYRIPQVDRDSGQAQEEET